MRRYSDFKDKCIAFIKGAHERLTVQTLWDAHPASYYHSAAQELMSLVKYFLRKHPSVNFLIRCDNCDKEYWLHELGDTICPECKKQIESKYAYDKVNISWKINGETIEIDEFNSKTYPVQPITTTVNGHNLKVKLNYYKVIKENASKLDQYEDFQDDLRDIVSIFLRDLITLTSVGNFGNISPFSENTWDEIIESLDKQIDKAFESMTSETISSQIMLYHPRCTAEADDKGFLFYSHFKPKINSENRDKLEKNIFSQEMEKFIHKYDDSFTSDVSKQIQTYYNDSKAKNESAGSTKKMDNGHSPGLSEQIKDVAPIILTDYNCSNKLGKIGLLEYNFLEGTDNKKIKPLCYQPKGNGPAGESIQSYVTRVFQEIGFEKSLSFSEISSYPAYMLMHMIEFHFGIRTGYSGIVTPLMGKGQLLGVLITFKERSRKNGLCFTQSEIELIESLAYRAGKQLMETKDYKFYKSFYNAYVGLSKNKNDLIRHLVKTLPYVINCYSVEDIGSDFFSPGLGLGQGVTMTVENKGTKEVHLHLKNYIPSDEYENQGWAIKFNIEEEIQIFEEHKIELETFLNYCWAITGGYIDTGGQSQPLQHGVE